MAEMMMRTGKTVEGWKEALKLRTKTKTDELASIGFSFGDPVKQFPIDKDSQFHYDVLKNSKETFIFPKNIGTVTGESYALAEADIDAFWLAAKTFTEDILDNERIVIDAIAVATTIDELKLITDER